MSQSRRFLIRMVLFLVLVAGLAALLGRPLVNAFMGNPAVNGQPRLGDDVLLSNVIEFNMAV